MTARQPQTHREHPDAAKRALAQAHTPLVWQADGATEPFLAQHVTDLISVDGLKASLGIAELAIQLPAFPEKLQPVQVIESPDWAALVDLTAAVRPIVAPAWAAPQQLPVAGRIQRQSWGRDVHLPVVKRIALTSDGADATVFAVPLSQAWQRIDATEQEDAAPQWGAWEQPKYVSDTSIWRPAKIAGKPETEVDSVSDDLSQALADLEAQVDSELAAAARLVRPSKQTAQAKGDDDPQPRARFAEHSNAKAAAKAKRAGQVHKPAKAKKVVLVETEVAPAVPEVVAAPADEPSQTTDAESGKVAIETPLGLWNVLGKAVGTVALSLVALMGTFLSLELTQHAGLELAEQAVERGVQAPEPGLQPLAQVGDVEAPLQLVLACAPATVECIDAAKGWLTLQKAQPETVRLVWLPLAATDEERPLVDVLLAARRQVKLWPLLENLDSGERWTAELVQEALLASGAERERLDKDLADPELHMQARSYQTMALGLLIGQGGALVAGKAVTLPEAATAAELAVADTQSRLQEGQPSQDLQQRVDLPDPNAAERYQHWILHGARMPAVAPSDQPLVPAGTEIELEP
jgi:hypothetical protein